MFEFQYMLNTLIVHREKARAVWELARYGDPGWPSDRYL